jgi:predicted dehydrogenase
VPEGLGWDQWLGVRAERPFIGNGWYHPGSWRKRLDFGTGTLGDMGCHIYDPVFAALELTAPISVQSDGPAPNAHSWPMQSIIRYVYPRTAHTEGETLQVVWYDGTQRPPEEVQALAMEPAEGQASPKKLPEQGSIFIGTEGVMLLPHVGMPQFRGKAIDSAKTEPAEGQNHYHQFVEAVLGNGTPSANFDYAGPLTEAVLLGTVAMRFPQTKLAWDAGQMRFTNVEAANEHVRRAYRSGWEIPGLS